MVKNYWILFYLTLIGMIIFIGNQPKALSLTLDGKENEKLLQLLDIKLGYRDKDGNLCSGFNNDFKESCRIFWL